MAIIHDVELTISFVILEIKMGPVKCGPSLYVEYSNATYVHMIMYNYIAWLHALTLILLTWMLILLMYPNSSQCDGNDA